MSGSRVPGVRQQSGRPLKIHLPMTDSSEIRIEYGTLAASEIDAMAKLLAETFSRHDPLAIAAGITAADFEGFVRRLIPGRVEEGLTMVARFRHSGELAGALLTEDAAVAASEELEAMGEKFEPVADILGQVIAEYTAGYTLANGEALHLYLLGVSDRAKGRGVAQRLVSACIENGARRGYRIAFAEASNRTSQHIFAKLGFAARVQRSYGDHLFKGERVFQPIAAHGGPILMDKSLSGS